MEEEKGNRKHPCVIVKKVIAASREQVFEAWTNPELMQHWLVGAPGRAKVAVDLRIGGAYSNEMMLEEPCEHDTAEKKLRSYHHYGEYLEIVPPERLVFTWSSPSVQNTRVTVDLRELESGTEVTITHELTAEKDCSSHTEGWTFALGGLQALLR